MRCIFILAFTALSTLSFSQGGGYEYYIMNSSVDEFDVLGNDAYEMNLRLDNNITKKLEVEVGSDAQDLLQPGGARPGNERLQPTLFRLCKPVA